MATPARQNFEGIAQMLDAVTIKQPATWGFVVYRCSYNNEDAWQTILQKLREEIVESLELAGREDLLPRHEMIIMDDRAKYEGATSHDIRDHFTSWVFDTLPSITAIPLTESERQLTLINDTRILGRETEFGTQYTFCLFVDDICLESINYMDPPVIKLLAKHFGALDPSERDYIIHPDYEDGETDNEEEDVGWMYFEIHEYVEMYDLLEDGTEWWYEKYRRPPLLPYDCIADQNPGYWRN
ncbi:hypothetical protein MGYG_04564 [Nannizzia gypsea CBS 118893]|uniref:Uncharacterized protein n=1 Tax=Arthroderma gypseum (strain ATCC MYA-4604 / CBS 118893) TaxID=535722 RepID=E4UTR9_ARTGP|nr:hypothetical protein MGYG_04564 [Nannizzia gypsea CBS 118893]EFR01562.1 hypothetical protein MGYG_04564 [Nannizzia gypsea CBS 118893]